MPKTFTGFAPMGLVTTPLGLGAQVYYQAPVAPLR
jgi:hypothetical protein